MARTEVPLTAAWVSIGTGPMTIQVKESAPSGPLYLNSVASDTAALKIMARPGVHEFNESSAREMFAKGEDYTIIVDTDEV
jgi:hypothetical protein